MFERTLAARGVAAVVVTAGFGTEGQPATRDTQAVAAARGLDLDGHRSRGFDADLAGADLVLAMERLHVRDLVVTEPALWARSFTLKEAVRRAEEVGPRGADEPFAAWLARLHQGRRSQDLMGTSRDDDVADPVGGPLVEHEETAAELDDLVSRFVDLAWPAAHAIRWSAPA
jgi:protein-tyrosine-phosphatase